MGGEFFRDGEARRGFGSSFGNILKFGFGLKNMVCHIFWPKAKRSKAAHGKRPPEPERETRSRILNGGHRREALGVGRLSHRCWLEPIVSQPAEIQSKAL